MEDDTCYNRFTFLPDEVLLYIFEYVLSKDQEAQSSIMPLQFVSKRWYRVVFTLEKSNRCLIYTAKDFVRSGYWELLKWCFNMWGNKSTKLGANFCDWIQTLSHKYHKDPAFLANKAYMTHLQCPLYVGSRYAFVQQLEREIPKCWYCEDWGHKHAHCLMYKDRKCALCDLPGHPEWDCKYLQCFVQKSKIRQRFEIDKATLRWVNSFTKPFVASKNAILYKAVFQSPEILEAMKEFKIVVCWICNKPGHPAFKCNNHIERQKFFSDKEVQNVLHEYAKKKWGIV